MKVSFVVTLDVDKRISLKLVNEFILIALQDQNTCNGIDDGKPPFLRSKPIIKFLTGKTQTK